MVKSLDANFMNSMALKTISIYFLEKYYRLRALGIIIKYVLSCNICSSLSNLIYNKLNYFTNQLHHVLSKVKSVLLLIEIAFEISPLHALWSSLPFMPIYCTRGIRKCQSKVINYLTMFHILADVHWLRFSKIKFFL